MPNEYAGSTYIGTQPMSFKRDPKDDFIDAEKQRWLEESGKLRDDQKAQTREGSVFMEYDDPSVVGGKRYVIRPKSRVPELNQGAGITGDPLGGNETEYRYIDPSGKQQSHRGRVMSFLGETGRMELSQPTADKKYGNKKFTNREFEQYVPEFEKEMLKRKAENERLTKQAEIDAADQKKFEREQLALDKAQERADAAEAKRRERIKNDPMPGERVQNAQAGLVEGQTELAQAALARKSEAQRKAANTAELAMQGADVPGYSKNAEAAIRRSYDEGMEPMEAIAAGRSVHDADAKRIWDLEASGMPASIREAQRLRASDPDLASIESRVPVRDIDAERRSVGSAVDSFLSFLGKKAKEEDKSWFNLHSDKYDDYSDFSDEEQQDIRATLAEKMQELATRDPRSLEDKSAIKAEFIRRMQLRGFPLSHIDAVMSDLEGVL